MIRKGGVIRNRFKQLKDIKDERERKKNRFHQPCFKDADEQLTPADTPNKKLVSSPSINALNSTDISSSSQDEKESSEYVEAKEIIQSIADIQKKIKTLTVNRFTSFKESEVKTLEKKIDELSSQAMQKISKAENILKRIRKSEGETPAQEKIIRNFQRSLAAELRECTKSLRQQEREYYERLRAYEKNSTNHQIQLPPASLESEQALDEQMMQQQLTRQNDEQVNRLFETITKLSAVYKEMNQLVIDQGSVVDRIDYNIEATLQHTKKAVVHLQGAEEAASSPFADRIIKGLVTVVIMLVVVMALKFSAK